MSAKDRTPQQDIEIAEAAERETEAQLAIIRVLKPLNWKQREKIVGAVYYLLAADAMVPGILDQFCRERGL